MGLDTSHDCWHGAYSSFHSFRFWIAKVAGIDLDKMQGFGGNKPFPTKKKEPLVILLNHSDCDGDIKWKDTLPLATRMEELLKLVKPKVKKNSEEEYFKDKLEQFIEGLKSAHELGEDVDFH